MPVCLAVAWLVALTAACNGSPAPPAVTMTVIPPQSAGGPDKTAAIAGQVERAPAGSRIVLFAKSNVGVWWVQPLAAEPFTAIDAAGRWKSSIHLGVEYAALLVAPAYHPPSTTERLPDLGAEILAKTVVPGTGQLELPKARHLSFSGYDWEVRQVPSDRGGENQYDPANAWVDAEGMLHLRMRKQNDTWTSAEVILTQSLGYGTYAFVVRDVSGLDPAAAFGMLTWDDLAAEQNHRELDIEISQWGDPSIANAQFVVQPYYVAANVLRFAAPAGRLTHGFRWEPGRASFRTVRGANLTSGPVIASHEFTSGVPTPGTETVRINLYFFRHGAAVPRGDVEGVIERFQYLP
jgi:hypothetical protein